MRLAKKLAVSLLTIGAVAFILAASAASAQVYPPEGKSLAVEASDPTPNPGESVDVTAQVTDSDDKGVAGADVMFTITSNPGDAEFKNGEQSITEMTDGDGYATVVLHTGDQPGAIVIRVEAAGEVSQVTVTTGDPQSLPTTGGAPIASAGGIPLTALAAAAAGIALLAGAAFTWRMRSASPWRRPSDRYSI